MSNLESEHQELAMFGAVPQPNSGRGRWAKGDGTNQHFVIDVKEAAKSFTLNEQVWTKISTDAFKVDPAKWPMLLIALGTNHVKRLAVIELDVLEELLNDYYRSRANDPATGQRVERPERIHW